MNRGISTCHTFYPTWHQFLVEVWRPLSSGTWLWPVVVAAVAAEEVECCKALWRSKKARHGKWRSEKVVTPGKETRSESMLWYQYHTYIYIHNIIYIILYIYLFILFIYWFSHSLIYLYVKLRSLWVLWHLDFSNDFLGRQLFNQFQCLWKVKHANSGGQKPANNKRKRRETAGEKRALKSVLPNEDLRKLHQIFWKTLINW